MSSFLLLDNCLYTTGRRCTNGACLDSQCHCNDGWGGKGGEVIDAFLQRRADASMAASPPSPGHLLPLPDNGAEGSASADGASMDGFFHALIAKDSSPL